MGIFDRFLGVPRWADALTPPEYARFEATLSAALRSRSLPPKVRPGEIRVRVDGVERSLAFATLARKCKLAAADTWDALVAEHLDIALSHDDDGLTEILGELDRAKPFLKVQLLAEDAMLPRWTHDVNFRVVAKGIAAVLALDLPNTVTLVEPTRVLQWGTSYDELFALAATNVRADPGLLPISHEVLDSGCVIHRLEGASHFVSAQVLWLGRFSESHLESGALVSIPSRHLVQFCAVVDGHGMTALQVLATAGVALFSQLPGPVSTSLYWMKGENVTPIPVRKHASGQIEIMPPRDVIAVLEGAA